MSLEKIVIFLSLIAKRNINWKPRVLSSESGSFDHVSAWLTNCSHIVASALSNLTNYFIARELRGRENVIPVFFFTYIYYFAPHLVLSAWQSARKSDVGDRVRESCMLPLNRNRRTFTVMTPMTTVMTIIPRFCSYRRNDGPVLLRPILTMWLIQVWNDSRNVPRNIKDAIYLILKFPTWLHINDW